MTLKHEDVCTLLENEEDRDILTRKGFDVNMRLFKSSPKYRRIVLDCAEYIALLALTEKDGYAKPLGWSGANAGIPFNIIAVLWDGPLIMINPKITVRSSPMTRAKSNCGSLRLAKPITVERHQWIVVDYFNTEGQQCYGYYERKHGGFTIQHEIDHNLGILITSREVK